MSPMMKTHSTRCTAETTSAPDFVDITDTIEEALADSGIRNGQVTVFAPDDGCSILVNERESGLHEDLKAVLRRLKDAWPPSVIGSASIVVPAFDGRLGLGMWQRVLLVELREAASRPVLVQVMGEA
jgi:secondary thiamine-phosphate synthase enzyme